MELQKVKSPVKPMAFPQLGINVNINENVKCHNCTKPINREKDHFVDVSPNPYSYWDSKKLCYDCGKPIFDKQIAARIKKVKIKPKEIY